MSDDIYFHDYRPARFIKDIERCPFLPSDEGYREWNENDRKRLQRLEEFYQEIKTTANQLLSHQDRKIRQLAHFVVDMIRD